MQRKKAARCLTLELENASDRGCWGGLSPLTSPEPSPVGTEAMSFTNLLRCKWVSGWAPRQGAMCCFAIVSCTVVGMCSGAL